MVPKKILYVTCSSALWGDNKALLHIFDHMDEDIVPFVVVGSDGPFCKELEERNISYSIIKNFFHVWPSTSNFRDVMLFFPRLIRMIIFNYRAKKKLIKLAKHLNPAIIHTNVGPVHIGYSVAKLLGIPHVWHLREFQTLDFGMIPFPSFSSFKNKIQDRNNFVITVSHAVRNYFQVANATVIYDGVVSTTSPSLIADKQKYFLFVGRISVGKGIIGLVEVFKEFCRFDSTYQLLIIGNGSAKVERQIHQFITRNRLEERIKCLGYQKDVAQYMQRATATIVPSYHEAFGFVTVEAIYNGCLVIGRNSGGTSEILGENQMGLLYDNDKQLMELLLKLTQEGIDQYLPMIKFAQSKVIQMYSVQKNIEMLKYFYHRIMEEKIKN